MVSCNSCENLIIASLAVGTELQNSFLSAHLVLTCFIKHFLTFLNAQLIEMCEEEKIISSIFHFNGFTEINVCS